MPDVFSPQRDNNPLALGTRLTEHTPADADLPAGVRAVCLNADGTLDIKNADGAAVAGVPGLKMVPLPFIPVRITAIGTATKVYLIR